MAVAREKIYKERTSFPEKWKASRQFAHGKEKIVGIYKKLTINLWKTSGKLLRSVGNQAIISTENRKRRCENDNWDPAQGCRRSGLHGRWMDPQRAVKKSRTTPKGVGFLFLPAFLRKKAKKVEISMEFFGLIWYFINTERTFGMSGL